MSYDLDDIAARCHPRGLADMLGLKCRAAGGGAVVVLCPEHEDRKPSCSLTPAPSGGIRARCFACGWTGDHFGLVGAVRGLRDFRDQLEALAAMVGVSDDKSSTSSTTSRAPRRRPPIALAVDREADRWLRGLDIKFTTEEADELAALDANQLRDLQMDLVTADEVRRAEQDARDDELERLADLYEGTA